MQSVRPPTGFTPGAVNTQHRGLADHYTASTVKQTSPATELVEEE